MKTMHLFTLSYHDLGDTIKIFPEVPICLVPEENSIVPRVCATTTIFQCLQSKNPFLDYTFWSKNYRTIYIYINKKYKYLWLHNHSIFNISCKPYYECL